MDIAEFNEGPHDYTVGPDVDLNVQSMDLEFLNRVGRYLVEAGKDVTLPLDQEMRDFLVGITSWANGAKKRFDGILTERGQDVHRIHKLTTGSKKVAKVPTTDAEIADSFR